MGDRRPISSSPETRKLWVTAALCLIAVATLVRLVLNFQHAYAPGVDAGYYPMQTRWLLLHGELYYEAPPLFFWLSAGLAKIVQSCTGVTLDQASLFSSRFLDVALPPWIAFPVMMLGYRWSAGQRKALVGCTAAAALAVLSPLTIRMASDFQKNSLGLLWMALLMWALNAAFANRSTPRHWLLLRWLLVAGLLLLAALTHAGAFGATVVMFAGAIVGYFTFSISVTSLRKCLVFGLSAACLLAVLYSTALTIAPAWTGALMGLHRRALSMLDFRSPVYVFLMVLVVYAVIALLLRKLWRARQEIKAADAAVVVGCFAGLAVLLAPVFEFKWILRFQLMAPVPLAMLLTFGVSRQALQDSLGRKGTWLAAAAGMLAMVSPLIASGPMMSSSAAEELKAFGEQIENPEETLIVAPHGVEFWAGMLAKTKAKRSLPDKSEREAYDRVLMLQPSDIFMGQRGPRHGRRPGGGHHGGPDHHRHHSGAERMQHPHDEFRVPSGAKRVYQGKYFDIFELF